MKKNNKCIIAFLLLVLFFIAFNSSNVNNVDFFQDEKKINLIILKAR